METLINVDNGGTLTDVCVWDGEQFAFAKTLTTPHDLSECLFVGITKASEELYGTADIKKLLHQMHHLRYSTTQGTNALVERSGPMIGILTTIDDLAHQMQRSEHEQELFDDLVSDRVLQIDLSGAQDDTDFEVVQLVNRLTTLGSARVVIAGRTADDEHKLRHILLRKFPRHLLGSIPLIYSWDLAGDRNHGRRAWSCVLNSFLHPTMERFLYGAERRLKEYKVLNPLLVYRNDGASSRVAKSIALKTYSSGPRGGLEGTANLAQVYGLRHTIMMDVGGTTTDVGIVGGGQVTHDKRGTIQGVPISYSMSNVTSHGVGGSSVIKVIDGKITVGPQSVGAAPGPACFGFGGKQATITDVNVLLGVLDPDTYLEGTFTLDPERSRTVISKTVAEPLGISLDEACVHMERAYFESLSHAFKQFVTEDSTLAAFGGAGPMSAAGAARPAGVKQVLIPHTAAVFSALGISFSDVGKTYEVGVPEPTTQATQNAYNDLIKRAERDMFQEGYALADCEQTWEISIEDSDGSTVATGAYAPGDTVDYPGKYVSLVFTATAALPHPRLVLHEDVDSIDAPVHSTRDVRSEVNTVDVVPVHMLRDMKPGNSGVGPAIIEGAFFTARVLSGWEFTVTSAGDVMLTDTL